VARRANIDLANRTIIMLLTFSILDWKAWFPNEDNAQPDVSVIPAMLRRRLSPAARMAVSVIIPLVENHAAMPLVYASRHGDLNRTLGLLQDLAIGEPLSPTAFSLSVHNATAGLFSIHQGLTKNVTALSGGSEELVPVLLEALGQCNVQEPKVLCVFCDEPPPAIYAEQVNQPALPYALAMIISRGEDWQLAPSASSSLLEVNQSQTAQPLQLIKLLQGQISNLSVHNNGIEWQLSRCVQW
jgi:hypothetical protein